MCGSSARGRTRRERRWPLAALGLAAWARAAAAGDCDPDKDYTGYRLREVEVWLIPPVRSLRSLAREGPLPRPGELYDPQRKDAALDAIGHALDAAVRHEQPVRARVTTAALANCDDAAREVDLELTIFETNLSAAATFPSEFRRRQREEPAGVAGVVPPGPRFVLEPSAEYDEADELVLGGRAAVVSPDAFELTAEGAGSDEYSHARAGFAWSRDVERAALWRAEAGAGYERERRPLLSDELLREYGFAWASGVTRPLGALGGALRYGAQLEYGTADSEISTTGFERDAEYAALALVAGITGGRGGTDFALSFGARLGADEDLEPSWKKLLADFDVGQRFTPRGVFFDHRAIDVRARVAAAWLAPIGDGRAPNGERFFGGARPRALTEIPGWELPNAPLSRGYPDQRLVGLAAGDPDGTEYFVSLNLTIGVTGWRIPLVPAEVREDAGFRAALDAQLGSFESTLAKYHADKDPAMTAVKALVEPMLAALRELAAATSAPDLGENETFADCRDLVEQTASDFELALREDTFIQLRAGEADPGADESEPLDGVPGIARACDHALEPAQRDARVSGMSAALVAQQRQLDRALDGVDDAGIARKVAEDAGLVRRAVTAFVDEINLFSIDPVVLFDIAHLGPEPDHYVRYSAGAGLRLVLGSHASLTLGYAANLNRGRGEPHGAAVVTLQIHDLLR